LDLSVLDSETLDGWKKSQDGISYVVCKTGRTGCVLSASGDLSQILFNYGSNLGDSRVSLSVR